MTILKSLMKKIEVRVATLVAISLFLTVMWFREGIYVGGGEEGLPLYGAARSLVNSSLGWSEFGTGLFLAPFIARAPLLVFVSLLQTIFNPSVTQAIVYFILLVTGTVGTYFLTSYFFKSRNTRFVASLFYLFNIYTMVQVWNRNIYAGYFAWAYLPTLAYFWIKWLKEGKRRDLIIILASSLIYSTTFVTISFLFAIWIPLAVYTLVLLWQERKNRKIFVSIFVRASSGVVLYGLCQLWWLYPYFKVSSSFYETGQVFDHFGVLHGLSQWYPNRELLLLRQTAYFAPDLIKDKIWYTFYVDPRVIAISVGVLVITLIGFVRGFAKKTVRFLPIMFLVGWFLVKGTNPPLGYTFYEFLFDKLPFTAMFRNSFEKLGVIFVLPYALLFAYGLQWVYKSLPRFKKVIVGGVVVLSFGVLVWPMWTGRLYADFVKLHVPSAFTEINKIVNEDTRDVRVITLPSINGESAFYDWGYKGVVPIEYLLDKPTISHSYFGTPIMNYYHLMNKDIREEKIESTNKWFSELNVGYIVVHFDLLDKASGSEDSDKVNNFLMKNNKVSLVKKFDKYLLYKFENDKVGRFEVKGEGPEISYTRESRTEYKVSAKGATGPYTLAFKNTYHDFWVASIDGVPLITHKMVDDWKNGWEINKEGDYNIKIEFKLWPWD